MIPICFFLEMPRRGFVPYVVYYNTLMDVYHYKDFSLTSGLTIYASVDFVTKS
ncbi:unnamed protein product [Malus baccata var. baccata]